MKDVIYLLFDIIVYSVQGLLLATLLKEAQPHFPFKRQYTTVGILLLQYVAVQLLLHYSDLIKSMLYGSGMLITCAVSIILFRESRLKTTYYVVTFYSVMELLKFAVYPVFMWLIEKLADLNQYLFLEKQLYTEAMFYKLNLVAEFFWNVFYSSVILVFTYIIIRLIKKYLEIKESCQKSEFVERFPELSLFYGLSSPLDSEMICIFPYFCPCEESAREIREILFRHCSLLYQEVLRNPV